MKTWKLMGSAASINDLISLMHSKLGWNVLGLNETSEKTYNVINSKGAIEGVRVLVKGKRYRLEMEQ